MGRRILINFCKGAVLSGACLCLFASGVAAAAPSKATHSNLLTRAEAYKTADHEQFLRVLAQLRKQEDRLPPAQKWHLRFLVAWQDAFAGKLDKADPIVHDIIAHSHDKPLVIRAKALLINILSRNYHYEKAFMLANGLMAQLPRVKDARARADSLRSIVQMLGLAGQYGKALDYAKQLQAARVPGESRCPAYAYEINALSSANRLSSESRRLRNGIEVCIADKQLVYANTLRLDKASFLNDEGHSTQAIALLHQIAPSIRRNNFEPHVASMHAALARAYLAKGNDIAAKKSALAALAVNKNSGSTWPSQAAYKVLYQVEKNLGHDAAALSYYEKYVALSNEATNNTKASALAYQMVKQQVLAKKLKLDALTKKNRILKLRQALAEKAAENGRLYTALLLIVLIVIVMWLYRLKHSQLRFRRMARHDDLTETFNRQHFLDQAKRLLKRLSKAEADACLIIMDLDHFKRINDLYGHIAGDDVLKHVVEISRRELRTSDVFGRLGGEEFGILMPGCSSAQGAEIGERIRRALATTPIELNARDAVTVSASFGLSCTSISGYVLVQLLIDADAALYVAKRSGRNRLIVGTGKEARFIAPDHDVTSTADPLSEQ